MTAGFGLGEFFSLSCALVWACAVVLFKKSGESLPPVPLNLFKNLVGIALMLANVLAWTGPVWPGIPPDAVLLAFLSGFLGIGVGDTVYFRALNAIGASRMAIAQMLYTPSVIVLSTLFLGERLAPLQLVGAGLVLGGVFVVNFMPATGGLAAAGGPGAGRTDARAMRRGVLEAGLAVLAMAAGVVMAKPLLEQHDFLWIVTLRIVGGTLGLLLLLAWRSTSSAVWSSYGTVRHWPAVIVGSVLGTYVSMILWLAGYKYTKASIAAVLNEMTAVFMLALAAVFLQDRFTPRQFAGSAAALAGVVLVVWPG